MEGFELGLKNDKERMYTRVRYAVELMGIVFFIAYIILENYPSGKWWLLIYLVSGIIGFEWSIRIRPQKQAIVITVTYGLLAIAWFLLNGWIALLHIILLVSNLIAVRKLNVSITNEGIVYPSFPKQTIQWSALQNVVLKDGVLTIDFKNDKLLQADTIDTSINEELFNQYCRQQLN